MLIVSTYKIAVLESLRAAGGKEAASNLVCFAGRDLLSAQIPIPVICNLV